MKTPNKKEAAPHAAEAFAKMRAALEYISDPLAVLPCDGREPARVYEDAALAALPDTQTKGHPVKTYPATDTAGQAAVLASRAHTDAQTALRTAVRAHELARTPETRNHVRLSTRALYLAAYNLEHAQAKLTEGGTE